MQFTEPDPPQTRSPETVEERLHRENRELKRQLEELRGPGHSGSPRNLWHPSSTTIWAIFLCAIVLIAVAFFAGYIPLQKRQAVIASEAHDEQQALPRMEVIQVGRSTRQSGLQLPGNIQPITEAPILARADGYIERRTVDIGDRVKAGQMLAQIDAPELTDQVAQATATVRQAQAALEQATANVQQGRTDMELARVMAKRSSQLVAKGAVSKQDDDQSQAQYNSKLAALQSLEKAIDVQRANIGAAQSNVARLAQMQSYEKVYAPFDGVIEARHIDVGALIDAGSAGGPAREMFDLAQTGVLRVYADVPQNNAGTSLDGTSACLEVSQVAGTCLPGTVARNAGAINAVTRTLRIEVDVPNKDGAVLPGSYGQVRLSVKAAQPGLSLPVNTLLYRPEGLQVATVDAEHKVLLKTIKPGRDFGTHIEVASGLAATDWVILNPSDSITNGQAVRDSSSANAGSTAAPANSAGSRS